MEIDFEYLKKRLENDRKYLQAFKNFALQHNQLELASKLRELEREKFPQAEDHDEKYELGQRFELVLRMVELKVSYGAAYRILKAAKVYEEMKGNFDIKTASEIIEESNEIFGE